MMLMMRIVGPKLATQRLSQVTIPFRNDSSVSLMQAPTKDEDEGGNCAADLNLVSRWVDGWFRVEKLMRWS